MMLNIIYSILRYVRENIVSKKQLSDAEEIKQILLQMVKISKIWKIYNDYSSNKNIHTAKESENGKYSIGVTKALEKILKKENITDDNNIYYKKGDRIETIGMEKLEAKFIEHVMPSILYEVFYNLCFGKLMSIRQINAKNLGRSNQNELNLCESLAKETKIDAKDAKKFLIIKIKKCECTKDRYDKIGIIVNVNKLGRIDCLLLNSHNDNKHYPNMTLGGKALCVDNTLLYISKIKTEHEIESNFNNDKGCSYISKDTYALTENDKKNIYLCGILDEGCVAHKTLVNNIKEAVKEGIQNGYDTVSYPIDKQIKYKELLDYLNSFERISISNIIKSKDVVDKGKSSKKDIDKEQIKSKDAVNKCKSNYEKDMKKNNNISTKIGSGESKANIKK